MGLKKVLENFGSRFRRTEKTDKALGIVSDICEQGAFIAFEDMAVEDG